MTKHRTAVLIGLLPSLFGTQLRAEPSVEVFTLSTLPITHAQGATVYYLDAIVLLEQELSAGLPTDPMKAQALVTRRMAALGPQLAARARAGATGLARAEQLGVYRAPAVVFDSRWAVYGMTDVAAARRAFSASRPDTRR